MLYSKLSAEVASPARLNSIAKRYPSLVKELYKDFERRVTTQQVPTKDTVWAGCVCIVCVCLCCACECVCVRVCVRVCVQYMESTEEGPFEFRMCAFI